MRGDLKPGDDVPSERELAPRGVSHAPRPRVLWKRFESRDWWSRGEALAQGHVYDPQRQIATDFDARAGVAGRYSNRSDLLEQLQRVAAIVSEGGQDVGTVGRVAAESVIRSRRLCDRFFSEDFQMMIDLYRMGATAKQVAEKFGISLRSIKRLLHQHGVRRKRRRGRPA